MYAFEGDAAVAKLQAERAARHEDWGELQEMTDLVPAPAACYPVYPAIAARGTRPPAGVFVDTGAVGVFRHEPSHDPARRQVFHMHELVQIGEPGGGCRHAGGEEVRMPTERAYIEREPPWRRSGPA